MVIAPNVPAPMLLAIHLGFDDRLLVNAPPVGPFLFLFYYCWVKKKSQVIYLAGELILVP